MTSGVSEERALLPQKHAEFGGPGGERSDDAGVEVDAVGELFGAATEAVFTGETDTLDAGAWRSCATRGGNVFRLAAKFFGAAEKRG